MLNKIKSFFTDLQQKDEETKKRWLIILTSGSMFFVILFWGFYLNLTVENLNKEKRTDEIGFLKIFKNGLDVVSKKTALKLAELSEQIQSFVDKTNSITIQGSADFNFVVKDLEQIKPKKLPK